MVLVKNARIWVSGNSYVITIPSDFISNAIIDVKKLCDIEISQKKEASP